MANWNPKRDPEPEKRDVSRFKDFLRFKYVDRRFSEDNRVDSSDEEPKKKKKKSKKQKKVESSSDESDEIVVPQKQEPEKVSSRKFAAPPGFKAPVQQPVIAKVVEQPKQDLMGDLLSFDPTPS